MQGRRNHGDTVFENINYSGKEINMIDFENCHFKNCNFSNAVVNDAAFIDCQFTGCDMSMLQLKKCRMNDAVFEGCKMLGINFSECIDSFLGISLTNCMADYSSFVRRKISNTRFVNTSLKNADFTEADLSGATFNGCNFEHATFAATLCRETDFTVAVNYVIDPEQNQIRGAKFSMFGLAGLLAKYGIRIVD